MKKTRTHLLLLAGAAALMLAGCGRDEPEVTVEISPEARSLLAHVPADTPYLAGNLAALPDGLDPALAAAMGCRVTTAWSALTGRAALQPGEGGLGMALAQALLLRGESALQGNSRRVGKENLGQASALLDKGGCLQDIATE